MSTTERLGGHAHEVADTAKEQTRELAHSASDHAVNLVGRASDQLRDQADDQGRRFADAIRAVTDDLRGMSEHSTGASPVGEVMCGIADAGDRFAQRLQDGGVGGLARELADYGRRNPGRFLLMSAAAGMLAGRLLRNTDTSAIKESITSGSGSSPADGPGRQGASGSTATSAGTAAGGGLSDLGIEADGGDLPPIQLPGDVAVPSGAPSTGGIGGAPGSSGRLAGGPGTGVG